MPPDLSETPLRKQWFSTTEAAQFLRILPTTLRDKIWRGTLIPARVTAQGEYRFSRQQLQDYAAERSRRARKH